MALMNEPYLKATLYGFIGMRAIECTGQTPVSRTHTPISVVSEVSKVKSAITEIDVVAVLERVADIVNNHSDSDIYAGVISNRLVESHYVISVILYS